jgi:uncharacterized small protein (DUF1192 family)
MGLILEEEYARRKAEITAKKHSRDYYFEQAKFLIEKGYPVPTTNIELLAKKIWENEQTALLNKEKEEIERTEKEALHAASGQEGNGTPSQTNAEETGKESS